MIILKNKSFFLQKIKLNPIRFSAINANENQHLNSEYLKYISNFALYFTPKSIIGCALSHKLCCKYIYENFIENNKKSGEDIFFLIMEDDAYPLFQYHEFYENINKTINDITILDKNWEIIQLHSDAFFPTQETYSSHLACGSTAAYLISEKCLKKNMEYKIYSHMDFIEHNFIRYNKYRSKQNLFYTDEYASLNRIKPSNNFNYYNMSLKLKSQLLNKIKFFLPLRGEKNYSNYLEFKLLKLPYLEKEYTANEIIDYMIGILLIKCGVRYLNNKNNNLRLL